MKKFNLFFFFLLILNLIAYSQNFKKEYKKAERYLKKKGEVYFSFEIADKIKINELSKIISIDNVKQNKVWAYANKKEFSLFLEHNIPFKVLPHPGDVKVKMFDGKGIWDFDTYPTYSQYESMMQTFATNYPSICKLDTIAILPSGRKILAIKISDNVYVDEAEPEFLFSGTIHGDETTGYVLLLRLINYLATNYGINNKVTNIVDNVELYICPLANPDGTYAGGNNTVSGATRYNANGIDLNRNFPDPRDGQHPDGNSWQPETIAFMNFADQHNFIMGANTHGGAEVVNYPWDTWTSSQNIHADNNWWVYVSREFADTVHYYSPSGYFDDLNNGITFGGDWYVITGGRQDYMNFYKHCREFTLELSATKLPPANQLPSYWSYLYHSFLNYIEQSLYGIRGIVTDSCTQQPIKAKIWIENHDELNDSSHVYSALPHGNYHRPIYAGTYTITVSAPGYQSKTISNIVVNNRQTIVKNVALLPLPPVADFTSTIVSECGGTVNFTNLSQYPAGSTILWNFGDGQTSTEVNPTHIYTQSGNYNVSLIIYNPCTGSDTIVKTLTINLPDDPICNDVNTCNNNVSLNANASGNVYWYDSPNSNTPVYVGSNYQTTVSQSTTFYVENQIEQSSIYGGDTRSNSNGGFYNNVTKHYLIFNCIQACKLVSVEVNAASAGNRTIELQNSSGQVLQSATIYIPAGISRITLNFDIPVGNSLRLVGPALPNLYRNTSGSTYPYNIDNYISIIGNSAGGLNYYYYFYKWEVKGPNCVSNRIPVNVNLYSPPQVNAGNDVNISQGASVSLNADVTGGSGNYSYSWSPANLLNNPYVSNPTTLPLDSSQTFYVTVTDNLTGCFDVDTININVSNSTLQVNIQESNNYVCAGTEVTLTAIVSGGSGNYSYTWESIPQGFSGNTQQVIVSPYQTTTYYLTVSDGTVQAISNIIINVLPLPEADFNYSVNQLTVQFTNLSQNASSYNWNFGDGNFSTEVNPLHTYSLSGTYNVELISTNNCGSDTIIKNVTIEDNGMSQIDSNSGIIIYPNPFNSGITIYSEQCPYELSIYSVDGKFIISKEINNKIQFISLDFLDKGVYYILVNKTSEKYYKLLIKH